MKEKSFRVYIQRTLKQVNPDLHITKTALEAVDSTIRVSANRLVNKALSLTSGSDKKTVSVAEIKSAVNLIIPSEMAKHSNTMAIESVTKFLNSEAERADSKEKVEKAQTRESRAGLIFSVSATEKYLRCFGQNNYHVSSGAPVYLAGILQYIASELLESAGTLARDNKKVTITVRHLFLAVNNNSELQHYINNLGVLFLEAGVEHHIEENLLRKKARKRLPPVSDGVKRPHRWRPGTKTLMDIRRLQKSGGLLMQHAPFNRLAREIGNNFQNDIRCSGEFLTSLQAIVEDRMIRVMKYANKIAIHAKRETVYARDIELACELVEPTLRDTAVYESVIPEAALRKMSLRAGIKRFGDDSSDAYRQLMIKFLENYINDITVCAKLHKVQTLNTKLLIEALSMRGIHPSIVARKRRVRKSDKNRTTSQAESIAESDEESEDSGDEVSDVEKEELATVEE